MPVDIVLSHLVDQSGSVDIDGARRSGNDTLGSVQCLHYDFAFFMLQMSIQISNNL